MAQFEIRQSFTVPAGAGSYAPEEIILGGTASVRSTPLYAVTALVETLGGATGAVTELWLLKAGGDPTVSGDWFNSGNSITGTGSGTWPLAAWRGGKIRVKSAGVAGTEVISAAAD